ncbi:DNA adenine methylase [Arcanobacterium bovis]|uniref:site-specific DNA-methyltransferase (adenine-specific) n=1 Tax=Arcanobacterium bovis TaxID=2529275 RepID=A0A4V6MYS5_9ACTO|nr:DNA adenine methylase [Arcanobacterium bovis]TBW20763.1 DNA adenine methylase [Arcanobacterium bovis]
MHILSPLRYPGGKAKLAPFLSRIISAQNPVPTTYAEPFAGGVGAGLTLLNDGIIDRLLINDIHPGIAAFWRAVMNSTERLCDAVLSTNVDIDQWHKQKDMFEHPDSISEFDLAFATFFLNRTNRSGILTARPIGGLDQSGEWKLDARWNAQRLCARIERIAAFQDRINITSYDAIDFIDHLNQLGNEAFVYVDPPYVQQGGSLYLNKFSKDSHMKLSEKLHTATFPWILTYDEEKLISQGLYKDLRCGIYELPYSVQKKYLGRELVIFSDNLAIPDYQITKQSKIEKLS